MNAPLPFHGNAQPLKAFVLGCDPTAFDKNKNLLQFEYVFDIGCDERYFAGVLANLKEIGLNLEDIYVQNLVTDYQEKETSTNIAWKENAEAIIPARKDEFDKIDPSKKLPVFLTSELLYKVLLNGDEKRKKAGELYASDEVEIPAEKNKLGRPLIALYRHRAYSLKQHPAYLERVRNFLSTI
jgi:hypothetical protein